MTDRWADHPHVEAEMQALDHIDEAMRLLEAVNGAACDALHGVKTDIERHVGEAILRIARRGQADTPRDCDPGMLGAS